VREARLSESMDYLMIDLSEYKLIYHEIKTGIVFRVKRLSANDFKIYNTNTGQVEEITLSPLRKRFKGDESNVRKGVGNFRKSKNIFHYQL